MAGGTWQSRHRRTLSLHMASGTLSHHAPSLHVTLITAQYRVLSQQRPRMIEFFSHRDLGGFGHRAFLADDRVAELTVLADRPAVPAHVIALVAAKAAGI